MGTGASTLRPPEPRELKKLHELCAERAPRTGNEHLQHALSLMRLGLFFAAASVLRPLFDILSEHEEKAKVARLIVHCGFVLNSTALMAPKYAEFLSADDALKRNITLIQHPIFHEGFRAKACDVARGAAKGAPAESWNDEPVLVVSAGGELLLKQLWCNLATLTLCRSNTQTRARVVVVHAAEIDEEVANRFRARYGDQLQLEFFDISTTDVITDTQLNVKDLRGYQIKLIALVLAAKDHRHVLMMDADLLWLRDPFEMIEDLISRDIDAFIFNDFWHFKNKQHEKSSSTSFLFDLHGVDSNITEFESGVVYLNRTRTSSCMAVLKHFAMNYRYYFSLTFGDKDLYYLATQIAMPSSPTPAPTLERATTMPKLLGFLPSAGEIMQAQSMVQSFKDGWESHIHTTLHPLTDDFCECPNVECKNGEVEFAQRQLGDRRVTTVTARQQDYERLPVPSVYQLTYRCAQEALRYY